MNEKNTNKMQRSDSVSSIDSNDDLDLLNQLTKTFLASNNDKETQEDDMQYLLNKENVLDLLKNLLVKMNSKTESELDESLDNEFEINEEKNVLKLNESLQNNNNVYNNDFLTDGLPINLIVTSVHQDVFVNNEIRTKFEKIFLEIDAKCKFSHFRIFKRCTIQFSNPIAAILARIQYDNEIFHGENLKMFLSNPIKSKNSRQFLEAPKNEKTFLISPPSSPPVGWVQVLEDPPIVNLELLATLSTRLNPHEPCELIKSNEGMPGIIIHPCDDSEEFFENNSNATRKFMPTKRPAFDIN